MASPLPMLLSTFKRLLLISASASAMMLGSLLVIARQGPRWIEPAVVGFLFLFGLWGVPFTIGVATRIAVGMRVLIWGAAGTLSGAVFSALTLLGVGIFRREFHAEYLIVALSWILGAIIGDLVASLVAFLRSPE